MVDCLYQRGSVAFVPRLPKVRCPTSCGNAGNVSYPASGQAPFGDAVTLGALSVAAVLVALMMTAGLGMGVLLVGATTVLSSGIRAEDAGAASGLPNAPNPWHLRVRSRLSHWSFTQYWRDTGAIYRECSLGPRRGGRWETA